MKFIVWARKRNTSDALWSDLPYAARNLNDAEDLVDYYTSEWGELYEYRIVRSGFFPEGMREPCFVGHM